MPIDKNQYVGVVLKTTPSALFMLCAIYFAFYAQIGERIQELRKQKGLAQQKLAELIEVSKSMINRYENKGVQPPADILNKIANTLDTSVDYLINGNTDEKAQATLKNVELLKRFKEIENLPEREQMVLLDVISAYLRDYKAKQAFGLTA